MPPSGRWTELVPPLPVGTVVCQSTGDHVVIEAAGDDEKELLDGALAQLEAKGFALDPDRTAGGAGKTLRVGLHQDVLGVSVEVTDVPQSGGSQLTLATYPACPPTEDVSGWLIENVVDTMLEGRGNDLYCQAVRAVLPDANQLPDRMRSNPAYLAEYAAFALQPTALYDALTAARVSHGKVTIRRSLSFDDPVFDGVRGRLGALLGDDAPMVVLVGGKLLGYVTTVGTDGQYVWIAPLDVVQAAEPRARAKPPRAARRHIPDVYVVHSD